MKRGTPDHPKTHRLARRLGIPRAQTVGHLELLWHWTAKFAPRGDVGRFLDADIEQGAAWEGAPGELVRALEGEGWLDSHPDPRVRLVVHDWNEHADDATKKALGRKGLAFIACPDNGGHRPDAVRTTADNGGPPEPLPLPLPEPLTTPPPPSAPPAHQEGRTAHGRLSRNREVVVEHWRTRAAEWGLPGPDKPARRLVWEGLARGLTVAQLCGSVDEQVRDALLAAGRITAAAPWPPEAVADRGPPASADVCSVVERCATSSDREGH